MNPKKNREDDTSLLYYTIYRAILLHYPPSLTDTSVCRLKHKCLS